MAFWTIPDIDSVAQRFWSKVDKSRGEDACWEYNGPRDNANYGVFSIHTTEGNKNVRAHRLAFFLAHGYCPPLVGHKCDHPPCVNDLHLLAFQSNADNMRDKVNKGRQARAHRAFTAAMAREIRERYASMEKKSVRRLAKEYGVVPTSIHQIIRRKSFAWLD